MNSQYHIDTQKHADYPLPAGLHCQLAFDRAGTKGAQQCCFGFCAFS